MGRKVSPYQGSAKVEGKADRHASTGRLLGETRLCETVVYAPYIPLCGALRRLASWAEKSMQYTVKRILLFSVGSAERTSPGHRPYAAGDTAILFIIRIFYFDAPAEDLVVAHGNSHHSHRSSGESVEAVAF